MNYLRPILFCLAMAFMVNARAQNRPVTTPGQSPGTVPTDTTKEIHILNNTERLTFKTVDDSTQLTIVTGNVKLRQNKTLIYCDSCILNSRTNLFEAWGNVHINDSDTANIYADHLRYLGDQKIAYLDGNVRLTDGKGTLTTPDLEYDMETNIGIYTHGGRVLNGKTVLTSQEGWYFADTKDVYFKRDVILKDPAYNIVADSLLYNTETKTTRFISRTVITDTTGRVINTREGFYNQQTGKAEFGANSKIVDGDLSVTARNISIDDSTKMSVAEGNAIIVDKKNGTTILAGIIYRNTQTEAFLATRRPLMIVKQNEDSIYVTADTLFSARLTDKFGMDSVRVDSVTGEKAVSLVKNDSTNRYFEGYHNVRIFNDSIQAVSDSMFYSFRDSTFQLYYDPVVWAQQSQITGDTIFLYTKNRKADRVVAYENGFMVNRLDDQAFNQVKGSRIDGWFLDGAIDSVRANGFAECIYFLQDEDSAYTGINQTTSDLIDFYFAQQTLDRVVFRSEVSGTLWPIRQKTPGEMKLANFRWLEDRRPKSKYEMFE
ncbi:MAG: OstA-like protein [Chitinophagaceae bacterium]